MRLEKGECRLCGLEILRSREVAVLGHGAGQRERSDRHPASGTIAGFIHMRRCRDRCSTFRGLGGIRLDLRAPVGVADLAVLRKLLRPGRIDALEERSVGPLDAYQKICAKEAFI